MNSAIGRHAWLWLGFAMMRGGYRRLLLHPYRRRRQSDLTRRWVDLITPDIALSEAIRSPPS